jgi:hypothetical protein
VTIVDVTAALKCSHEPPESDVPWIDCPSLLTIEDIVSDMCEGQYADKHRNTARKAKIPQNIWFVDVVLYRKVCPLGHKTQRRDMFLSALYFVPQRLLVLHSLDHMETNLQILGRNAPSCGRAHKDLGFAYPFSHHSHIEKEGD